MSLQLLFLYLYPALLPLLFLIVFCALLGFRHCFAYRPAVVFSAQDLQLQQQGQWRQGQWGRLSKVGLGFCLIEFVGERSQCVLIFSDSISDADYRRLCFTLNLREAATKGEP